MYPLLKLRCSFQKEGILDANPCRFETVRPCLARTGSDIVV